VLPGPNNVTELTCTNTCPTGTAPDSTNRCVSCQVTGCTACTISLTGSPVCTQCTTGTFLFNNTCVSTCPTGFGRVGNACQACPTGQFTSPTTNTCASCTDVSANMNNC